MGQQLPTAGAIAVWTWIVLSNVGASFGFHWLFAHRNDPKALARMGEYYALFGKNAAARLLFAAIVADAVLLLLAALAIRELFFNAAA